MLVRRTGEAAIGFAGMSERISLVLFLGNTLGWRKMSVVLGGVQVLHGG